MASHHEYVLDLATYQQNAMSNYQRSNMVRPIMLQDKVALSELLLDAFLAPQAHNEQNRASAERDIDNYFAGTVHQPLLDCSWGYWKNEGLAGACLVSYWKQRQRPLLDCIATRSVWKCRGVSSIVFRASLASLIDAGYNEVCAIISQENPLPRALATRIGFTKVDQLS